MLEAEMLKFAKTACLCSGQAEPNDYILLADEASPSVCWTWILGDAYVRWEDQEGVVGQHRNQNLPSLHSGAQVEALDCA